jgi:hypothetical protein
METLYEKPFCKITYHNGGQPAYIHADWVGFSTSAQFRESCETVLTAMQAKKISRVIMDGGKAKVAAPADQEWFNTNWIPRAIAAGYRTSAVVVPRDLFGQMSTKQVVSQVDKAQITTHMFDSTDQAKAWIVTT